MDLFVRRLLRPGPPAFRGPSATPRAPALGTMTALQAENEWSVRVHVDEPGAGRRVREAVVQGLARVWADWQALVVVCVGTDRSTGDALGPLTGHRLQALAPWPAPVFGTLEDPVHAGNLSERITDIGRRFPGHAVVAVDACLGSLENVGTICVGEGALRPGAGVNKVLPPVGHLHVTGVVNVGGFMEYFVLQNTRLHLVMRMSGVIAEGLADLVRQPPEHHSADADVAADRL